MKTPKSGTFTLKTAVFDNHEPFCRCEKACGLYVFVHLCQKNGLLAHCKKSQKKAVSHTDRLENYLKNVDFLAQKGKKQHT